MRLIVHPIARAWLTAGGNGGAAGTGAQNYDEFADEAEITPIIEANPHSALAVEMPHRAPESLGMSFTEALPAAVRRLAEAKRQGAYAAAEQVVVVYRITEPEGTAAYANSGASHPAPEPADRTGAPEPADRTAAPASAPATPLAPAPHQAYGMFAMVDTDQISTSADQPGLVIRNEDVFEEKVRERVALAEATEHLLSPVLLLQSARGHELQAALVAAVAEAGPPAATDVDQAGRTHELWPLPPGATADELCRLASGGELVVADGNHRSLAAQTGGLPRFLAVVTTPESVTIQPYNRLLTELPFPASQLPERLARAGATPTTGGPRRGVLGLYADGALTSYALPADPGAAAVDNLDHALVERLVIRAACELDPGDKRVVYVGGDYPVDWLRGEVDAGRAEAAILIAPVSVDDFVEVNLARQKLPRKSTWFTPKARAGLVLAELG